MLSYKKYNTNNQLVKNFSKILEFNSLIKNNQIISFFIFLTLLSMAGIPPLIGFYAKSAIFLSIIDLLDTQYNNNIMSFNYSQELNFVLLLIIGLISSCYSVYNYLRIIKVAFFNITNNNNFIVLESYYYNNFTFFFFGSFCFLFNIFGIFFLI